VPHDDYKQLDQTYFESLSHEQALIADLKGMYRGRIQNRPYWSL
jgi:UDP-N-acetyl-D-galactosamine dehydrogenase